jgi:hypothetical protein
MSQYDLLFDRELQKEAQKDVLKIYPKAKFGHHQQQATTGMLAMWYAGYKNAQEKNASRDASKIMESGRRNHVTV